VDILAIGPPDHHLLHHGYTHQLRFLVKVEERVGSSGGIGGGGGVWVERESLSGQAFIMLDSILLRGWLATG